jgi:hypothetical protein
VSAGKAAGHEWKGSKVVFDDAEEILTGAPSKEVNSLAESDLVPSANGLSEVVFPLGMSSTKQLRKLTRQILKKVMF